MAMVGFGHASAQDNQANCTPIAGIPGHPNDGKDSKGVGDPVDVSLGEMVISRTCLNLPGPSPLIFTMTYDGSLLNGGSNWYDNCHQYLTFGTGAAGYWQGNGVCVPIYFGQDSSGNYTLPGTSKSRPFYVLTRDSVTGYYLLTDKLGNKKYFYPDDGPACLVKSVDRNGNELDYNYETYSNGFKGNLLSVSDPVSGRFLSFSYDPTTNDLTSVQDSTGRTVTLTYTNESTDGGVSMLLTGITLPATTLFPSGTTETYEYDSDFNLREALDAQGNAEFVNVFGNLRSYERDRITQQTVNGNTCSWSYNDTSNEVSFTNFNGVVTDYYNDANRNLLKTIVHTVGDHPSVASGTTYETDYSYGTGSGSDGPAPASFFPNNCYKTKEVDPNGNGTSWTYDQYGNVLTATKFFASGSNVDPSKGSQVTTSTTTYTYDSVCNQVASKTDPNGNVTTYTYDDSGSSPTGNLLSVTLPTSAVEKFTYNSKGQVLTDTKCYGTSQAVVTQNTYDPVSGYLTSTVNDFGTGKLNATINYTHDSWGNIASVQNPNGNTVNTTYDAQGHIMEIDGANGEVEQRTYDSNGNLTVEKKKVASGEWEQTTNVYNSDQELIATQRSTDSGGVLETDYTYDVDGNRTSVKDPLGHITSTAYDERDQAYLLTDATGKTVRYDFDGDGNTTTMTDESSKVTSYAYDGFNRLEQKTFADGSTQSWKYDAAGNTTSYVTTAGNTITQTFDSLNRMLTQSYTSASGPSTITNAYDLLGRVTSTTEGGTSLTYAYDDLGRNTSFTDQAGRTSTYTYDLDGNRLNSEYPTGLTVKRSYDTSDRLTTLRDGSNNTMATVSYDIADRATGLSLGNSTTVSYGYDLLNRLSYVHNSLGGSVTRNYNYSYDDADRVISTTEPRGAIGSSYTDRNEVNGITEPSGSPFADQSWIYDPAFNREAWTLGTKTTNYTVNNLDQYTTVGSAAPTWNADGGLAAFDGKSYVYDSLRRLTEVDYTGGKTLFSYDPMGRRVKKIDENSSGAVLLTYQYHYDGSEVAVEYQPSTTWTYYLGNGIDRVVLRDSGSAKQWYYRDGQGSVSAVADNSGNVLEQYEYTAQGWFQVANASGTVESATQIANYLMYTGREFDYETNNYFYRARYYSPKLGRFISRDPLSGAEFSQGTNLYAYCGNNYLNSTDPTGMCDKQKEKIKDLAVKHFEDEGYPHWLAESMVAAGSFAIDHQAALETTNNVLMAVQMLDGAGELEEGANLTFQSEHAIEHWAEAGVDQAEGEQAIANQVQSQLSSDIPTTFDGAFMGRVDTQGVTMEYRGFGLPGGSVNIGTAYPVVP